MEPQYTVSSRIAKPVGEVFDAIVDPAKLSSYFTTIGGASGPLVQGTKVRWWDIMDISVIEVRANELIKLQWPEQDDDKGPITIEIKFDALDDGATLVTISESGYARTLDVLKATYSTCSGWTQMLACLKAWLEYGINLREGAFLSETEGKVAIEENHDYLARTRAGN